MSADPDSSSPNSSSSEQVQIERALKTLKSLHRVSIDFRGDDMVVLGYNAENHVVYATWITKFKRA